MRVSNFDKICFYVRQVIATSATGNEKVAPSTAIVYGEMLNELLNCLEGLAIRRQGSDNSKNNQNFSKQILDMKSLFRIEWKKRIAREAKYLQKIQKINMENIFPLAEDIKNFNFGLTEELEISANRLKEESSDNNWKNLAYLLLTKNTAFNARRPLEPGLMELQRYEKITKGSSDTNLDFIHLLTESEKIIAASMEVVKVVGKHGRIVPILLTQNFVKYINLLIEKRDICGISQENPYIFPLKKNKPLHGSVVTRKVVNMLTEKYNLIKPQLITAKQFRRILSSRV